MIQCINNKRTFYKENSIIRTHIDDLLAVKIVKELRKTENMIWQYIKLDIKGNSEKMLGIEINWTEISVTLMQTELIRLLAELHKITGVKSTMLLDKNYFMRIKDGEKSAD